MNAHHHSHHQVAEPAAYRMQVVTHPENLEAGKEIALSFRPGLQEKPHAEVELELVHEKQMHLIVISRDLSYFAHLHPLAEGAGSYSVSHVFPAAGEYILFEDYTPKGWEQQHGRQVIRVGGTTTAPRVPLTERLHWQQRAYELSLNGPDGGFSSGEPVGFTVTLQQAGLPVMDLTDYLGSLAHIVIISEDTTQYLHVHPMPSQNNGPAVLAHTFFPNAGKYKVFFQFLHEDRVHTADFVLQVR